MTPKNPPRGASVAFDPVPSILVYDKCPEHRTIICQIVSQVGACPAKVLTVQQPKCSAKCCVAVVGMGTEIEGDELQFVRKLRAAGFRVIACRDAVESWLVKARCLPLLAGAAQLLDKAATDFTHCLCRALKQALVTETKNQQETQQITSMMRAMGMVGQSAAMMRVFRRVASFSRVSDLPVLISGETGTGKKGWRARCASSIPP